MRYADDFMILKRSRKAAERTMESMTRFVEGRLFLRVNREKSFVAHISRGVRYLGYGFYRSGGELRFRVHPKSMAALKDRVREILVFVNRCFPKSRWSFPTLVVGNSPSSRQGVQARRQCLARRYVE